MFGEKLSQKTEKSFKKVNIYRCFLERVLPLSFITEFPLSYAVFLSFPCLSFSTAFPDEHVVWSTNFFYLLLCCFYGVHVICLKSFLERASNRSLSALNKVSFQKIKKLSLSNSMNGFLMFIHVGHKP